MHATYLWLQSFSPSLAVKLAAVSRHLPDLLHMISLQLLATFLLSNFAAAIITFVCVEVCRDIFHALGHNWRGLTPHHAWHHAAYKRDFIKRWGSYYPSLWHNDMPESIMMVLVATGFCLMAYAWPALSATLPGCLFILLRTLRELGIKILRILKFKDAIETDATHKNVQLTEPPSQWRVNLSYHYRHHFDDPYAYLSGTITLLDKLMKTALSLKGRTIAFNHPLGELDEPLRQQLTEAGAVVLEADATLDVDAIAILVLDVSTLTDICPQATIQQMEQFLTTVQTNRAVTTKEIWLMISEAESALAWASLDALYQRYLADWVTRRRFDAPCILRKIVVGRQRPLSPRTARKIVTAVQRDMRNIVVGSSFWTTASQPIKEWIVTTTFRLTQ